MSKAYVRLKQIADRVSQLKDVSCLLGLDSISN
jgi:hypothetical protein